MAGKIAPPSIDTWFENYSKLMLNYAKIAEESGSEHFSIGSEFVSLEKYTKHWKKLIADLREVYSGKLTYSANWDHVHVVEFWDDLDWMGMTGYFELSSTKEPTLEQLVNKWAEIQQEIDQWRIQALPNGKIHFTELGYPSLDGGNVWPWDYTLKHTPDHEEQRLCYQAFFEAWKHVDWLGGVYFYDWYGDGVGDARSYSPKGKPAEDEIKKWFVE